METHTDLQRNELKLIANMLKKASEHCTYIPCELKNTELKNTDVNWKLYRDAQEWDETGIDGEIPVLDEEIRPALDYPIIVDQGLLMVYLAHRVTASIKCKRRRSTSRTHSPNHSPNPNHK